VIVRAALSAIIAAALLPLAGCGATTMPAPAEALGPLVAAQRQCAPLIAGAWPIDLAADRLKAPGIDALIAAGILTRKTTASDTGERPSFSIEVAPGGRDWVELRQLNQGGGTTPFLCYGKRQLADARAGAGDTASYSFRVVEAAPWTARPDINAAFPFLRTALGGKIEASTPASRRDGQWLLPEHADWQPGKGLEQTGFYPCLPGDREHACG